MFGPWFSVSGVQGAGWLMSPEDGDKGLIPKELRKRIKQFNPSIANLEHIMKHTRVHLRKMVLQTYRACYA